MTALLLFCVIGLALWIRSLQGRVTRLERDARETEAGAARGPLEPAAVEPAPSPAARVPASGAGMASARTAAERTPAPEPARQPIEAAAPRRQVSSGQVLAVAGGGLVLLGTLTFITMAISNGWIGPLAQVLLGYGAGAALSLGAAAFMTRRGRDLASLVAVGVGTGIVLVANAAGVQQYEVIDARLALLVAVATSAWTVWWASHSRSQSLAAYGITTGLAAPALVGAAADLLTLALLAIALAGAAAVSVLRGWAWLSVLALVLTAPQLAAYVAEEPGAGSVVAILAWWGLLLAAAIGYDLLHGRGRLRSSTATICFLAAGVATLLLDDAAAGSRELLWALLAALHLAAAAVLGWRRRAESLALALWLAVVGTGVLALAGAAALDGPAVVPFWVVEATALACLAQWFRDRRAAVSAALLGAAAATMAMIEVPAARLHDGAADISTTLLTWLPLVLGAALTLALLARIGQSSLVDAPEEPSAPLLDRPEGGALVVVLAASSTWLALALGTRIGDVEGGFVSLAVVAALAAAALHRWRHAIVQGTAVVMTVLLGLHGLANMVRPDELAYGAPDLWVTLLGGGVWLAVLAILVAASRSRDEGGAEAAVHTGAIRAFAVSALYVTSVIVVSVATGTRSGTAEQAPQLALSVYWGAVGLAAVILGLMRRVPDVHRSGAALLGVAAVKVLVLDTQQLEPIYRVGTLVAVGLAMLLGGFAYLRLADRS